MTIRDFAHYQYNTIKSSYMNNMSAVSGLQRPSPVQTQSTGAVSEVNQTSRTNSDSLQFLNQYKSEMDSLKSAAERIRSLSKDGVWSDLKISSSDESIVSNATTWGKVPQRAEYDIEVKQLAKRQISQITAADMNSNFEIKLTDNNGNAVTAAIQVDATIANQADLLNNIVDQINAYESKGIRASLIEGESSAYIQIEGEEPGIGKTFEISDNINSTTTQEAQNLIYTLNGEEFTSSSNHNIQIDPSGDNNKLRLNFDKVGHATIKADVDTDKLAQYTEKLVEAYNQTVDFLVDNAHRGSGVSKVLDRLMQAPIYPETMAKIGLNFGKDGKISFEADKFQKAMEEDTRMAYDILADNYSVADTIYQKVNNASNYFVSSLLDKSRLQDSNGGVIIINNYFTAPNPFSPSFFYPGSLFFNTKA